MSTKGILNIYQVSMQNSSLVSQFAGSIISIQPHYWRNNCCSRKERRYIKRVKTNVLKTDHYTTEQFTCIETCDKKTNETNDLPNGQYSVNRNIRFKTSMLRSDLCD